MIRREYRTFSFCCGLGGGAKGSKKAASQVGNMIATWKCIGGIDMDQAAARDFEKLVGVKRPSRGYLIASAAIASAHPAKRQTTTQPEVMAAISRQLIALLLQLSIAIGLSVVTITKKSCGEM